MAINKGVARDHDHKHKEPNTPKTPDVAPLDELTDEDQTRGNSYLEMRRSRIERNMNVLQSLGLLRTNVNQPSTPQVSSSVSPSNQRAKKRPSSVPASTQKSPRLLERTVDLTDNAFESN